MIANDPKILEMIEESELKAFQKDLLKTHLKLTNDYIISVTANNLAMDHTRKFSKELEEENATKAVYMNVLLSHYYERFTEEEIENIKEKVMECLKSSGETSQT